MKSQSYICDWPQIRIEEDEDNYILVADQNHDIAKRKQAMQELKEALQVALHWASCAEVYTFGCDELACLFRIDA